MKKISIQSALVFCAGVLVVLLSGCGTQNMLQHSKLPVNEAAFSPDPAYQYRIQKGDKISLSIWDHDDLSVGSVYGIYNSNEVYGKWLLVDIHGQINVPQVGAVQAEGYTVKELQARLTDQYQKYIVKPIIDVKILNKEITLMGEVKTPGKYLLEKDYNTLLDVIGKAGDFDFYANKKKIQVIRKVNGVLQTRTIDLTRISSEFTENIQIYPGDVVFVPSRKGKTWDKRSGSIIIPIATSVSTAVLLLKLGSK